MCGEKFKFDFDTLEKSLVSGLKQYLKISGASGFVVGVSGGLDSAVVATLCAKAGSCSGLMMPTLSSNPANIQDAKALLKRLAIPYKIINISPIISAFETASQAAVCVGEFGEEVGKKRISLGNLAARVRMSLLYDFAFKHNLLVAGTSNKSERMLGYGTIWGDLACGVNPIGEIYKSELFAFAEFLGVEENIIKKPPSADLWEGQSDEGDLGYSYSLLDAALKELQTSSPSKELDEGLVSFVAQRVKNSEFKRRMPLILPVS